MSEIQYTYGESAEPVSIDLDKPSKAMSICESSSDSVRKFYVYALLDRAKLLHIDVRSTRNIDLSSFVPGYTLCRVNGDGCIERDLVNAPDKYKNIELYVNADPEVQLSLMLIGEYFNLSEANLAAMRLILEYKPVLQCGKGRFVKVAKN